METGVFYFLVVFAILIGVNCQLPTRVGNEGTENGDLKEPSHTTKLNALANIFRKKMQNLKGRDEIELIILVDGSYSVGPKNFLNEMRYIQKVISDVQVGPKAFRLGIIIFSSEAVIHVDHLSVSDPSLLEKCSLLQFDIPKIAYPGRNTNTKEALEKAERMLTRARKGALKVVFLITDGFSNMGNPLEMAEILKEQGTIIYTFGIENGNANELMKMATHPPNEHAYLFDSFDDFEGFARRALHKDLTPGLYAPVANSSFCSYLCPTSPRTNSCCSEDATCSCGLISGHFACLCPPGYYGSGLADEGCKPCPQGTYKEGLFPGDDSTCVPCPDVNHVTIKHPASSKSHCVCKNGTMANGDKCFIVSCTPLSPPTNGYFVKKNCSNVVNAACGVRCHMGYILMGTSVRICQKNGTWSGVEPFCRPKSCQSPKAVASSEVVCFNDEDSFSTSFVFDAKGNVVEVPPMSTTTTSVPMSKRSIAISDSDADAKENSNLQYTVGTVCNYTCLPGHSIIGSKSRGCLPMLKWSGLKPTCKSIRCPSLPEITSGSVKPKNCTAKGVKHFFGDTCRFYCNPGYELRGPRWTSCTGNHGTWSEKNSRSRCVDTEPPKIECPRNITTATDDGVHFATIKLTLPETTDNSGEEPIIWSKPPFEEGYPLRFAIGETEVQIYSVDEAGNYGFCSFVVEIKDEERPKVLECQSPPVFYISDFPPNTRNFFWNEPVFDDNSGIPISVTRKPLVVDYPKGTTTVVYTGTDAAGNNASCSINITVLDDPCSERPTETNTLWTCSTDSNKVTRCIISCPSGSVLMTDSVEQNISLSCTFAGRKAYWIPDIFQDLDVFPECSEFEEPEDAETDIQIEISDIFCDDFNVIPNDLINEINEINLEGHNLTIFAFCDNETEGAIDQETDDEGNLALGTMEYEENEGKTQISESPTTEVETKSYDRNLEMTTHGDQGIHVTNKPDAGNEKWNDESSGEVNEIQMETSSYENEYKGEENVKKEEEMSLGGSESSSQRVDIVSRSKRQTRRRKLRIGLPNTGSKVSEQTTNETLLSAIESIKRTYLAKLGRVGRLKPHIRTRIFCRKGSLLKNGICVKCPKGTFHNVNESKCDPCPLGHYQETEGQTQCISCPAGYSTKKPRRRHSKHCHRICPPGTFGKKSQYIQLALSPCSPCPVGFYQSMEGQAACESCPRNFTTPKRGATALNMCINASELDDPCFNVNCRNGGTCSVNSGFPFCTCLPGYIGSFCERIFDPCGSSPCYNGGQCYITGPIDYACRCPTGFEGENCETDVNECSSNPCSGHGECTDLIAGFSCDCSPGFTGLHCNETIKFCDELQPCLNSGTCVEVNGTYACICPRGYSGLHCDVVYDCESDDCGVDGGQTSSEVILCENYACPKNQKCIQRMGGVPSCVCSEGFRGVDCTEAINPHVIARFPKYGVTEYLLSDFPADPLSEISICVWIKTKDAFNYGTLFSYATPEEDNAFTLTDYSGLVLYVSGRYVVTDLQANDGFWHFVCVTWQAYQGRWHVYLDGSLFSNGTGLCTDLVIPGGGKLVVGQEQDAFGGGFNDVESFAGRMTYFDIWNRILKPSEVQELFENCDNGFGNMITWPHLLQNLNGDIQEEKSEFCNACDSNLELYHGTIAYEFTQHGTVAKYICDEGYIIKFDSNQDFTHKKMKSYIRKCMKYGGWHKEEPKCGRISCGFPGYFLKGKIIGSSYLYGDRISYRCLRGYSLIGNHTRFCLSNGVWSGHEPDCHAHSMECQKLVAPRHGSMFVYFNKTIPYSESLLTVGDRVEFICDRGYVIKGFGILTCMEGGLWDREPATCEEIICPNPTDTFLQFSPTTTTNNSIFHFGDTIRLKCPSGLEEVISCGFLGHWNLTANICKNQCKHQPDNVKNGYFPRQNGTGIWYEGETLQVRCLAGFKLQGDDFFTCSKYGTWIQVRETTCQRLTCGPPPQPPAAYQIIYKEGYNFGDRIFLRCAPGFQSSGEISITCQANGRYSRVKNHCTKIFCKIPTLPFGYTIMTQLSVLDYGSKLLVECPKGKRFIHQHNDYIECQGDGKWSSVPECH